MVFQYPLSKMKSHVLEAFLFLNRSMHDFVLLLQDATYL